MINIEQTLNNTHFVSWQRRFDPNLQQGCLQLDPETPSSTPIELPSKMRSGVYVFTKNDYERRDPKNQRRLMHMKTMVGLRSRKNENGDWGETASMMIGSFNASQAAKGNIENMVYIDNLPKDAYARFIGDVMWLTHLERTKHWSEFSNSINRS